MTEEQYKRSNKTVYPSVMICCGMVILTLIGSVINEGASANRLTQIIGIVLAMMIATIARIKLDKTKKRYDNYCRYGCTYVYDSVRSE